MGSATQDRESKLRDQIAALEAQTARLQAETDAAKKAAAASLSAAPTPRLPLRQNGFTTSIPTTNTPSRPESRSTVFVDSRVPTPTGQLSLSASNVQMVKEQPQESVWDSIHAPTARRGVGNRNGNGNGGGEEPIRLPMTPKAARRDLGRAVVGRTAAGAAYARPPLASPTPSNVSAAPTLGDDGWWS